MRPLNFLIAVVLCLAGMVGQGIAQEKNEAESSSSQPTNALQKFDPLQHEGIWQSDGYGYVVEIKNQEVKAFHVVDDVCVAEPDKGFFNFFDQYKLGDNGNALVLSSTLDPFEFTFRRLGSMPAVCGTPTPDTPQGNFKAFAKFFNDHYAFFDIYGVDWKTVISEAESTVTANTTDEELFKLMSKTLGPLKDAHIKIKAEVNGEKAVYDGNQGRTEAALKALAKREEQDPDEVIGLFRRDYWIKDIKETILGDKGVMAANGRIQYGVTSDDVGYIAFVSMGGFVDGDLATFNDEIPALDKVMEDAITLFEQEKAKAVIVDLSLNIGGYDFVGLSIAGRFAKEKCKAFDRRAGDDPDASEFPLYVEPSIGKRFTGPVYVLSSDQTVSAAEILTLGMRGARQRDSRW